MARLFLPQKRKPAKQIQTNSEFFLFTASTCTGTSTATSLPSKHMESRVLRRESISRKTTRIKMTLFPANRSECVLPPGSTAFLCQLREHVFFYHQFPASFPL